LVSLVKEVDTVLIAC